MPSVQADFFASPLPAGFAARPGIITPAEEQALIAVVDAADLTPFRFQGWVGKRLTASYGWHYDFDAARFAPAPAIPAALLALRDRAAGFAGLAPELLVQVLVTRYDPGAGIGWHRDRPVFEHVVGISLGAEATMRFRRRTASGFERASAPLAPRAAYHLAGESRHVWEHSIVAIAAPRRSITFRSLSAAGLRC